MAAIDTGKSFANGEQLTAAKLNQMFGNSTFASGAVDNSTMTINSLGQLAVNQVTSSNIATNALNLDDIQQIDTDKVLGRTSAETGNVEQVDIVGTNGILLDEDDLTSDSNTQGATQQSIKAYVDSTASALEFSPTAYTGGESVTFPNGLIMKWGLHTATTGVNTITFGTTFPNACLNIQYARYKPDSSIYEDNESVTAYSTAAFQMNFNNGSAYGQLFWQAIGY